MDSVRSLLSMPEAALLDAVKSRLPALLTTGVPALDLLASTLLVWLITWLITSLKTGGGLRRCWDGFSLRAGSGLSRRVTLQLHANVAHNMDTGLQAPSYSRSFAGVLHHVTSGDHARSRVGGMTEVPKRNVFYSWYGREATSDYETLLVPRWITVVPRSDPEACVTLRTALSRHVNSKSEIVRITQMHLEVSLPRSRPFGDLGRFVERCCRERQEAIDATTNAQQLVFTYERVKDDGTIVFSEMPFHTNKSFDNLFFDQRDALVRRLGAFERDTDFYERVGMPHTFGMLLHGAPGTGKTSVIKAVARYTRRHVVRIALARVDAVEVLTRLLTDARINERIVPLDRRLYVFEEVDCAHVTRSRAHGEEPAAKRDAEGCMAAAIGTLLAEALEGGDAKPAATSAAAPKKPPMTLGDLLEALDGVHEMPGRMLVMTTNYVERLDSALLRPGRIDMQVEFAKASRRDVDNIFRLWYGRKMTPAELERVPDRALSHAEVCEALMRARGDAARGALLLARGT